MYTPYSYWLSRRRTPPPPAFNIDAAAAERMTSAQGSRLACWTNDREIGVAVALATGGRAANVGQLLFAPWAWVYSTLHPFGVGK